MAPAVLEEKRAIYERALSQLRKGKSRTEIEEHLIAKGEESDDASVVSNTLRLIKKDRVSNAYAKLVTGIILFLLTIFLLLLVPSESGAGWFNYIFLTLMGTASIELSGRILDDRIDPAVKSERKKVLFIMIAFISICLTEMFFFNIKFGAKLFGYIPPALGIILLIYCLGRFHRLGMLDKIERLHAVPAQQKIKRQLYRCILAIGVFTLFHMFFSSTPGVVASLSYIPFIFMIFAVITIYKGFNQLNTYQKVFG